MKASIHYASLVVQNALPVVCAVCMLFISSCSFHREQTNYPSITIDCAKSINWNGIIPLQSTRADIEALLGKPDKTGIEERDGIRIAYAQYGIEGGTISKYNDDRIFFTETDEVLWIEAIVADREGTFQPISEIIKDLGPVDTVHINSNLRTSSEQFDFLGGPDQIYVWATCGVAASALIGCFTSDKGILDCEGISTAEISTHIVPTKDDSIKEDRMIIPTTENAVMMLFIFPPTSLEAYNGFYKNKIPFGIWNEFIEAQ